MPTAVLSLVVTVVHLSLSEVEAWQQGPRGNMTAVITCNQPYLPWQDIMELVIWFFFLFSYLFSKLTFTYVPHSSPPRKREKNAYFNNPITSSIATIFGRGSINLFREHRLINELDKLPCSTSPLWFIDPQSDLCDAQRERRFSSLSDHKKILMGN